MTADLTASEQRCIEAIVAFIHRRGRMPTMAELAGELTVTRNRVTVLLDHLAAKGAIKRNPAGTLPIELKVKARN